MEEKISVLRLVFKSVPDLIILQSEYRMYGTLLNLFSEHSIDIKDLKQTKRELISPKDFPVTEWNV